MKWIVALTAAAVWFTGAGDLRAEWVDGIKVVVHDSIITYQQVDNESLPLVEDLSRKYRNEPETLRKQIDQLLEDNTEHMVENQLILHEFETAGYNLPESVIDDYVQQRIRSDFNGRATLMKTLQARGMTFEKYRKNIRDQFILYQMRAKNISEAIVISPHKIETYYVQHTNDYKVPEQVKLRMIVFNAPSAGDTNQTRQLAQEVLQKINEGASFAEMAAIYNPPGSPRSQGGDWGWVQKYNSDGAPVLRKELFDVAFTLPSGQKSGVIETPDACYLMLVEDKRPEHIRPLNEVRDDIEKNLLSEERDRLQKQWISRLKKKTFVRYF